MHDEHFLIVRLGAVGDVVMASALARRVRSEHPGATVTWLSGLTAAPLVEHFADVDDVITIDERRLLRGGPVAKLGELVPLWAVLLKRRFTHVLLAHVDKRYRVLIAPVVGATVIAQTSRDAHGAMNPIIGRYFGDEYARLLDGLVHRGPIVGHYPLGRLRPLPAVPALPPANETARKRVALVPGGGRNVMRESAVRRWPATHYARVAEALVADGVEVILIGDASDDWVRPSFAGMPVVDLIGGTSLPETLAALASCDLVISHDTGPMHLARLAGAPLLALFGPTMPAQFVVEDERTTVLWGGADLACRPCYDGREFAVCADNVCMSGIAPATVVDRASTLLARGRPAIPHFE